MTRQKKTAEQPSLFKAEDFGTPESDLARYAEECSRRGEIRQPRARGLESFQGPSLKDPTECWRCAAGFPPLEDGLCQLCLMERARLLHEYMENISAK